MALRPGGIHVLNYLSWFKGFIYIVRMKRKSEVLSSIKQFAKEVGAPDAIVSYMAKQQVSQGVRNFCNAIGTMLRALEEGTPWSNEAELYIKIMKEAVCKDMRQAKCPLCFWDYCLECLVEAIPTQKLFVSKGISPSYANSVGTTGVIFGITRPLFLTTKKYLVVSLDQPEGNGMNYHSGYSSPTVMRKLCSLQNLEGQVTNPLSHGG